MRIECSRAAQNVTGSHRTRVPVFTMVLVGMYLLLHAPTSGAQSAKVLREPSALLVRNVLEHEGKTETALATFKFNEHPSCDSDIESPLCKRHSVMVTAEVRKQLGTRSIIKGRLLGLSPLMSSSNGLSITLTKSVPTDDPKFIGVDVIEYRIAADGKTVLKRTRLYSETVVAK